MRSKKIALGISFLLCAMIFYDFSFHLSELLNISTLTVNSHTLYPWFLVDYGTLYQPFWTVYWGLAFFLAIILFGIIWKKLI